MKLAIIVKRFIFVVIISFIANNSLVFGAEKQWLPILTARQGWGLLGINSAVLPTSGKKARAITINGKIYEQGLGTHAPSSIVLDLFGNYETFEAKVGVQTGNPGGTVVFQLFGDGEKLFDSGLMTEKDSFREVKVPVKGAEQLELVVTDGGDGLKGDVANWADIVLVACADGGKLSKFDTFDIAAFGKVYSWDPTRVSYHPNRVAELSVEEIFQAGDVVPESDGTYIVPTADNGEKCIGLQWYENRNLRGLYLEFAENSFIPEPNKARVEWWIGASAWQGDWIKLTGEIEVLDNGWYFPINFNDMADARKRARGFISGALKIRYVFADCKKPVVLKTIKAFSRSRSDNVKLLLECESAKGDGKIRVYNGQIIKTDSGEGSLEYDWDLSKKVELEIKYCLSKTLPRSDRTIVKLELPDGNFGVAVEDVIENGGVYIPDYGVYVTCADKPLSLEEYKAKKILGRKTVLEKVREMPDQSFERAMDKVHREIQDQGPMMVSLAGDNIKYIVERKGKIRFSPKGSYRNRERGKLFHIVPKFGSGKGLEYSRSLYGGWMPVPVQSYREGDIRYEQRSFVAPSSKCRAAKVNWLEKYPMFVSEFTICNSSSSSALAKLAFSIMAKDKVPAELKTIDGVVMAMVDGKIKAFIKTQSESKGDFQVDAVNGKLTVQGKLAGNSKEKFVIYIPGWDVSDAELARLKSSSGLLSDTKRYWEGILADSVKIDIPNKLLKNLIIASQVHCMIAARNEEAGKRISPWISADIYGPLESEAQSIIRGMSLMGHEEFSRRSLDFFINKYNKDGLLTTGYTLWGIGWHLWTLGDYYMVHRNSDWLNGVAPKLEKACNWIVSEREKTKRIDAYGEKVAGYGLMPPGVFADWSRFAYLVRPQGEFCAGLVAMAQSMDDIKYPGGDVLVEKAAEFQAELLRAYLWSQARSSVIRLSNDIWVPYSPTIIGCFGTIGEAYPGEDGGRAWGKDISAGPHHLAPLGILTQKDSREINWIASYLEDEWFLKAGHGDYSLEEVEENWFDLGGFYKIQPYYCRITELYAQNDDVKPFIRAYFNAIPTLLSRENLSLWEHFHNIGGWNKTHETGWFLAQTRLMFVQERNNDELWIAPFVTNHWMRDGMKVSVRNAKTRFGVVSYEIVSNVDDGIIKAEIDCPTRNEYKKIVLRLRHPEGKAIKSVIVNGKPFYDYDKEKECIMICADKGKIRVIANYEK